MAVEKFGASERFACKVIGQNRSAFRKKKPDIGFEEARLRAACVTLPASIRRGLAEGARTCRHSLRGRAWR
ncbi:hypothetical protein AHiyo8_pI67610 (plasmid) [Arthrobacter sp. Hiyo8]|nr:hypothetical protein AHiyo8_pI67610 [Arthrobacter sp. Hiyo8]GAP60794.1 hypothetical protein AHiyo1_43830 [Arthrobacter sp. Hiyo1]